MFITRSFNNVFDELIKGDCRKVLQIHPYTLQIVKIWNSAVEAGICLGLNKSHISKVCRKERLHHGGYYWRYYDEFINEEYIRCDKNNYLDIFNLLPGGNLSNYIEPCFTLLPNEEFRVYERLYKISNYGRVISIENYPYIKELKPCFDSNKYLIVCLCDNNNQKTCKIHRLVAEIFIPNPNNLPEINHINEIKTDNRVENLEWCTREYNNNYGTRNMRAAISRYKIIEKYDLNTGKLIEEFKSISEIEKVLNISSGCISEVCNGKRKSAGGFGWRFKEIKED